MCSIEHNTYYVLLAHNVAMTRWANARAFNPPSPPNMYHAYPQSNKYAAQFETYIYIQILARKIIITPNNLHYLYATSTNPQNPCAQYAIHFN